MGCRKLLDQGDDPIAAKRQKQREAELEAAKNMTVAEATREYLSDQERGWKNQKHRDQVANLFKAHVFPVCGQFAVRELDLPLVLKMIRPIWYETPETASRLRQKLEGLIDWATVRKFRSGGNPAAWGGNLEHLLPSRRKVAPVVHHPALPYAEMAGFMELLRAKENIIAARALEFTVLCATRTAETTGARWDEIDFDTATWTIPAERMKAARAHKIPLAGRAVAILRSLPIEDQNPFVFIGNGAGKGLSNSAMLKLIQRMGRGDLTSTPREVGEVVVPTQKQAH